METVGEFMHKVLMIEDEDTKETDIESVRSIKNPSKSRIKDEVLVIFKEVAVRDRVARQAPVLARAAEVHGMRPGLHMEIPRLLMATFKLLERHGHQLRRKHGDQLKRHIKFEDCDRDLILSVKFPGEDYWMQVTPEFIRSLRKEEKSKKMIQNRARLSTTDDEGGHEAPRAAALTGANTATIGGRNVILPSSENLLGRNSERRRGWGGQDV